MAKDRKSSLTFEEIDLPEMSYRGKWKFLKVY